jgi:large subunit ribosomal protein L10
VAMKLEDKKAIVAEVNKIASQSLSAVAADYRGLTVEQMTQLRVNARKNGIYMQVVRNTLARRALEGTEFSCLQDALTGPLFLAFALEDPGAVARLLKDACKDYEKLEVKAIALGGQLLGKDKLDALAKLPTKEQALVMMMCVMKAPITQFVRTLAETYARVVRVCAAVRDKKQA